MIKNIRMNRHPKNVAVNSTSCEESSSCWYAISCNRVVGDNVGEVVGEVVGKGVGEVVGEVVGKVVGDIVGKCVGERVGEVVGEGVQSCRSI